MSAERLEELATDAVTFLSEHMDAEITLPTWVPFYVHLDTPVSVLLATYGGIRSAQLKLATERVYGALSTGVSALDGCVPEHSIRVTVPGSRDTCASRSTPTAYRESGSS
jgi:hypothetical protein